MTATVPRSVILVLFLVFWLVSPGSCARNDPGAQGPGDGAKPAVPVSVAEVVQRDVPVQLPAIAAVEPFATVTIKPQVSGQLTTVHFTEGQDVRAGDPLFTIDPRPFEAASRQAKATLEKDDALAKDAESEAAWKADLYKQGVATQREYESAQATAASRRATVLADQAALEKARLDLEYCTIHSPIEGRTGSLLVNAGNIVKINETVMLVINQLRPIYVSFSVPEQRLGRIREFQAAAPLKVQAAINQDDGPAESGVLTFIDNQVDRATGMIALKGTFANENRRLWPGQYVNAVLSLTTQAAALVVPSEAVQPGQSGRFVYVVKKDLTIEMRPVVTSVVLDGEIVVSQGLGAGEKVVTEGHLRLAPGTKVQIKNQTETTQATTSQAVTSQPASTQPTASGGAHAHSERVGEVASAPRGRRNTGEALLCRLVVAMKIAFPRTLPEAGMQRCWAIRSHERCSLPKPLPNGRGSDQRGSVQVEAIALGGVSP